MIILSGILPRLFSLLPSDNSSVYALCKKFIDDYNGDNNSDIMTNGELWLMRQRLPASKTVFDVGANVGDWTALALAVNPALSVHCFEPSRPTFQRLLARNFGQQVSCNNFGLSSRAETRALYTFGEASGLNSLYLRHGLEAGWNMAPQRDAETIQLESLDTYCQDQGVQYIDFLKLDVEGHELEALRGAVGMLSSSRVGVAQVEYGGTNIDAHTLLKDIFEFFAPLPYAAYKLLPASLRGVARYDQRLENFQYQNWVFIRK